jgi:hypothetical protein
VIVTSKLALPLPGTVMLGALNATPCKAGAEGPVV